VFIDAGWDVRSPQSVSVLVAGIPFVRFDTDPAAWGDPAVQTRTLHRILSSDVTYVVAPDGYVGRTTSYEIGRVIQADRPLYFSDAPKDLPIAIPSRAVAKAAILASRFRRSMPRSLYDGIPGTQAAWERQLNEGPFLED
jgi:hypothetical protein